MSALANTKPRALAIFHEAHMRQEGQRMLFPCPKTENGELLFHNANHNLTVELPKTPRCSPNLDTWKATNTCV